MNVLIGIDVYSVRKWILIRERQQLTKYETWVLSNAVFVETHPQKT